MEIQFGLHQMDEDQARTLSFLTVFLCTVLPFTFSVFLNTCQGNIYTLISVKLILCSSWTGTKSIFHHTIYLKYTTFANVLILELTLFTQGEFPEKD